MSRFKGICCAASAAWAIAGCTPPFVCVDGGYSYKVRGRVSDAASGEPVCCTSFELSGVVSEQRYGFPAHGYGRTGADGTFVGEMGTGLAWGRCGPAFSCVEPPPQLSDVRITVQGRASEATFVVSDLQQKRVGSTEAEVDLGTLRVAEYVKRPCRASDGSTCPLPAEMLRPE